MWGKAMPSYQDFLPTVRFQRTLAISPDGRKVAYVDDVLGQFNLAVQDTAGGNPQRLTSYTDSSVKRVCWHPSGQSLVYLADRKGDENAQIFQLQLDGELAALTDAPNVQHVAAIGDPFTSDGRRFAYAANDRTPEDQDVLVRDLTTGSVQRVYADGGRVFAGHWSPDAEHLSVAEWREGNSDHVIYLVRADGGEPRRLTRLDVPATYWLGPWLPDGSGFIVRSNVGRDFTGLGVLDASDGRLSWIDTPDWDVEDVALSRDGRTLVWTVNVEGTTQLRARDLTTNANLTMPTLPAGTASNPIITDDGRKLIALLSTPSLPENVVAIDLGSGRMRPLTDSKPAAVGVDTLQQPALIRYSARDGMQIPGVLYRPSGLHEPIGVVVAIHGGPPDQERAAYSQDGFFQYLVSNGVAVFAPNVRGSTGYGMSYQKLSYRDWGGGDLRDFADAIDYLREQSWVDASRIGLFGRSYGGFAVLSCIARLPDVGWAAAVAWCGPSNLLTFTRAQPPTWRSKVAAMIGDPDIDKEALLARSPVTYADQIRSPLFVIQGANDVRVPKHESDQIVQRLRARGVNVRYDVYPDEGHVFGRRENQIKARSSAADFLLQYLRS